MPLSSGTVKFITSLRQKKFRQSYHKFIVEGTRSVAELLAQDRYRIDHLYALGDYAETTPPPPGVPLTPVSARELGRISQLTTPNRVLAVVDLPTDTATELPTGAGAGWSLYLDGVQSPSNLGALLRIADWFGFGYVFGGPGTADLYNPKSIQASMGSFLRIDYRRATLEDYVAQFPDLPRYGADLAGRNVYGLAAPPAGLLVIGAEGRGLSPAAGALIQHRLTIPRAPGRRAESLNAAVAAGILCGALVNPTPTLP